MIRHLLLESAHSATHPPANSQRYTNLDRTLVFVFLSVLGFSTVLYIIHQCLCQPDPSPRRAKLENDRARRLESIPVIRYRELSPPQLGDTTCSVCLAEYVDGEEARVLPACGHAFHKECIDRWLLTVSWLCPICRKPAVEGAVRNVSGGGAVAIAVAGGSGVGQSGLARSSC